MDKLILKPGRETALLHRHPWIYSGAVARIEGNPASGATVDVYSAAGQWLAKAAYSPKSQITARVWSFNAQTPIDADFYLQRLATALHRRQQLRLSSDAYRLVYAESDGLPGIIIDRYTDVVVMQLLSAGAEMARPWLITALQTLLQPSAIVERSDAEVRQLEGLLPRVEVLTGHLATGPLWIEEQGLSAPVDVLQGHKTGFYLDQRANRAAIRAAAAGRRVLDCFAYTGACARAALAGGATSVLSLDESGPALALAQLAMERAAYPGSWEGRQADVFKELRRLRDRNEHFDLIILDPPKFAPTAAHAERAAKGYKDINLLALKLLAPGGLLFTYSCSGGVDAKLFQQILAGAARDAHLDAQIIGWHHQAADHPVALHFPESAYLKGLNIALA